MASGAGARLVTASKPPIGQSSSWVIPVRADSVVEQCNGCDVLIHEVYTEAGYAKASPAWQRMRRAYHTSSRQLGELATRARPGLLILYHQSYQFTESTEENLMREMRAAYR